MLISPRRNAEIGEATSQYENLSQALEKRKAECVATDADLNEAQQHHAKVRSSPQPGASVPQQILQQIVLNCALF